MVLANVPSFRFLFQGNMRTCPRSGFRAGGTSECTLVLVFVPGEHPPKPPFWKTTLLSTPDFEFNMNNGTKTAKRDPKNHRLRLQSRHLLLDLFKVRPVQFGALPAAAEQLFTKPLRPKIELNLQALSWFFLKEKPQNSYEPWGLVNSLVSGNTESENLVNPFVWTWTWLKHFQLPFVRT